MAQKYCTEIGSLFQVRNPAVTTHFFSFKELQLLEKKEYFWERVQTLRILWTAQREITAVDHTISRGQIVHHC